MVVCHRENSVNGLVTVSTEAPGANCTTGGIRIDSGLDTDYSGVLDPGEVTDTQFVCNGLNGADGADGATGPAGGDGLDGANRADGATGPAGPTGPTGPSSADGTDNRSVASIAFAGGLQGGPGVNWTYKVNQLNSGDVIAEASIQTAALDVAKTTYLSSQQVGFPTAPVLMGYDLVGPLNFRYRDIGLDRNTLVTVIQYHDTDQVVNPGVWTMLPSQCIVNDY